MRLARRSGKPIPRDGKERYLKDSAPTALDNIDLAASDDIEGVAILPRVEDDFPGREVALTHQRPDLADVFGRQMAQQVAL